MVTATKVMPRVSLAKIWVGIGAGIGLFFLSIGRAASLYPGGSRFDLGLERYSFFGNFLCDLFDAVAYNGMANPGRPYALFGTYALAIALLFFWWLIPNLFESLARHRRAVRIFGTLAMTLSLFIATPLHDACIIIAVPFGLAAFTVSICGLLRIGEKTLGYLGVAALAICLANYLAFVLPYFPAAQPGFQKAALGGGLSWVLAVMQRLAIIVARFQAELPNQAINSSSSREPEDSSPRHPAPRRQ